MPMLNFLNALFCQRVSDLLQSALMDSSAIYFRLQITLDFSLEQTLENSTVKTFEGIDGRTCKYNKKSLETEMKFENNFKFRPQNEPCGKNFMSSNSSPLVQFSKFNNFLWVC